MAPYTLCVVDMQKNWEAANDPQTIAAVEREVRSARRQNCPVLLVWIPYWSPLDEEGYPRTHKCIRDLLKGYSLCREVEKRMWDDGAPHVLGACQHYGFGKKRLRIVGVNTAGCVLALVKGLVARDPAILIDVVMDACNSAWDKDSCWEEFRKLDNVTLLPTGDTPLAA